MTYDGKILARARTELDRIRAENKAEQQYRLETVYARIPEIQRIDAALRGHMAELVRLTISRPDDMAEQLHRIKEENLSLQMRRAELMTEHGFGADYLDEIVSCPLCRDTGIYGGGVCSCLEKLYNRELTKELGTLMRRGSECFESFDLTLYPNEPDPVRKVIPREAMRMVFDACRRYADNFSSASPNLMFQGGTGLGKTYLSACIARAVAGRGFSVCYESAAAALDCYESAKFARDTKEGEAAAAQIRRMEDCDLMILDDLGTEMITSMSQSALYTLINRRLINGRPTIISTNCGEEELRKKYTSPIVSRILGEFRCLPFVGQDIRRLKK